MVDKNNVIAEFQVDNWHIPRPTLALGRCSLTSIGSTSTNSTQSARSGSLLLTAANLALIKDTNREKQLNGNMIDNLQYYYEGNGVGPLVVGGDTLSKGDMAGAKDADSVSVASSTHFTVVNVNCGQNVRERSFCRRHQLTVLVVSMSVLIFGGIMAAILFMELRARK